MFAKKPEKSNHNNAVALRTNCYALKLKHADEQLYRYSINFEPDIAGGKIDRKIIGRCAKDIGEKMEVWQYLHKSIYSTQLVNDEMVFKAELEDQEYTVTVKFSQNIDSYQEKRPFFALMFKKLMQSLKFQKVGRNCFNPNKAKQVQNLEIWPGFYSSLQQYTKGFFIQMDLTSKVLRKDVVLEYFDQQLNRIDKEQLNENFKGATVVCSYYKDGKRTYRVEDIDFNKSIEDGFDQNIRTGKDKKDVETKFVTYKEYFEKQYGVRVSRSDQPLLRCKLNDRIDKEIYLLPELCEMTGLTDEHRANFNLMKEMGQHLHKDARTVQNEVRSLIEEFSKQEKSARIMKQFGFKVENQPMEIQGQRMGAGNVLMSDSVKPFAADCRSQEFDRSIQSKMRQQKDLNMWGVVCTRQTERDARTFKDTMKQCLDQFNFQSQEPRMMKVDNDRDFGSWERMFSENLNPKVQFIVIILPGAKKKGIHYNKIKKLFFEKYPIPLQVVLGSTISRGKNLRSICNKILIQMNAKAGGIPWSISHMPFTNKPTMVLGISQVKYKKQQNIYTVCGTHNREFNKFFSKSEIQKSDGYNLQPLIEKALDAFNKANKIFPVNIIIIREGVGDSQKAMLKDTEISNIKQGIQNKCPDSKLLYSMVNTRIKSKFTSVQGSNPQPGTIIDHSVNSVDNEGNEDHSFFLVSTECRQGVPTPTHYSILVDEVQSRPEDFQQLVYKLSYLYYNFSGAVKLPNVIKYANRLANSISDHDGPVPHNHYDNLSSLYYI